MRTISRGLLKYSLFACFFLVSGSASATPIAIYSGIDNGAGPGGPFPNSTAAQSAFLAGTGLVGPNITFEGLASLGVVAPGASASLSNADPLSGLLTTDNHGLLEFLGFNITTVGNEWLRVVPNFSDAAGASVTFSFTSGINAFGLWFTDTESNQPGPISLTFNDGVAESLSVTKNGSVPPGVFAGGTVYYGFVTDALFNSVTIQTGAIPGGTRDLWGIDDITFGATATTGSAAVPEPTTLSLLATGVLFLARRRRRARNPRQID